ncbi:MAG: hypothetical protein GX444_20270, partial [Myxococcales bacterium]|nr:hypothetical protein [Myxococcales bacterium]
YAEYRDGAWHEELVDVPEHTTPLKYILDYDSQNRPGVAVHTNEGAIDFYWRNK